MRWRWESTVGYDYLRDETGRAVLSADDVDSLAMPLIAAAPDLLEALGYWLPKDRPFEGSQDPVCIGHRNAWDRARAAISKAEGK